ncbi:hypothetical protein BS47DRAFT_1354192 [Hydnum rufescens UP504]|uniref:Uncharacterized protein n=1 Tax=Hydnum rufescens UP504 TaxID=1448309 RepID=A0A9P6AG75_9AGAM|nr:hypothetical protein BS47DRAFT_1354192 [Hydnum rufescens UP504]
MNNSADDSQGLMPISGAKDETRKLFWFFPAKDVKHINDIVFWTNGGHGCSSLSGLLQEHGYDRTFQMVSHSS